MSNENKTAQLPPPVSKAKKKNKKKKPDGAKTENLAEESLENAIEEAAIEAEQSEEAIGKDHHRNFRSTSTEPGSTSIEVATPTIVDKHTNGEKEPTVKLDALVAERDNLRAEVSEIRKSLELIQEKHEAETGSLREELLQSQNEKNAAESSYKNLLGKVNQIKSQLGERLKADAEDLEQARADIKELEARNSSLNESNSFLQEKRTTLEKESNEQSQELSTLRDRLQKSQQNWIKERDDILKSEARLREEFEIAKNAMQDWEVLAMEERSLRENLADRLSELEEQLAAQVTAYKKISTERDDLAHSIDGLQRALNEIQDERKRELRELVEKSQSQIEELSRQVKEAEALASSANTDRESARNELERVLPFEREAKEKNLLIGKLRHEAVILNDHLTKALRFLKKGNPEDNVDRQIVTNHLLQFLTLDRSDPKKFQILQLIAALLGWDEEQREQAGLARPTSSSNSLRVPMSPFRRSPSQQSFSTDLIPDAATNSRESLAELWSDFLRREAQESTNMSDGRDDVRVSHRTIVDDDLKSPKTT